MKRPLLMGMFLPAMLSAQAVPEPLIPRRSSDHSTAPAFMEQRAPQPPTGKQIVAGYMGAVLVGFLAWRAWDEPAGKHRKVKQDWGYTPEAHTALGIGSYLGATLGVWVAGRRHGANGKLWSTALWAAVPSAVVLTRRDDPLLPFMAAIFGAPLQGTFAYLGYRATATKPPPVTQ